MRSLHPSPLALGLALALGCGGDSTPTDPAAAGSRFESVQTVQGDVDQVLRDNCDTAHDAASAPTWHWPTTNAPVASEPGRWTWVNFWATWCHPCVEELPMLQRKLSSGPMGVVFLSVDADDATVARFKTEHAFEGSLPRVPDQAAFDASMRASGIASPGSLPIHVLVDPSNKVRCVRAGAVEERHVDAVLGALGTAPARPRIR